MTTRPRAAQDLVVLQLDGRAAIPRLTKAERHIVGLLMDGLSNTEIAARRGTSVNTVNNQIVALLRKLKLDSRVELAKVFR